MHLEDRISWLDCTSCMVNFDRAGSLLIDNRSRASRGLSPSPSLTAVADDGEPTQKRL